MRENENRELAMQASQKPKIKIMKKLSTMSCLGAFIAKPQYKITKISKAKTNTGEQNGMKTKKVRKEVKKSKQHEQCRRKWQIRSQCKISQWLRNFLSTARFCRAFFFCSFRSSLLLVSKLQLEFNLASSC